jgi:hypothetical protein
MPDNIMSATAITAFSLPLSISFVPASTVCAFNILETLAKSRIKIADFLDMA